MGDHSVFRMRSCLLAVALTCLTACNPAPHYQGVDMSSHNTVALAPVCVGQFNLQFPSKGASHWITNLDWAEVERLPARLHDRAGFWSHVHARRDALASQHHDSEPSLLYHYEEVGEHAALLLHRNIPINKRVFYLERYLWLGDRGYLFRGLGEGEKIKGKLSGYKQIFSRVHSLAQSPPPAGFCIDGAVVDRGSTLRTSLHARPAGLPNTLFTVGTIEAPDTSGYPPVSDEEAAHNMPFGQLDWDKEQFSLLRSDPLIRDQPASAKEFEVLRRADRTVAGRPGQEAIWRTTTNHNVRLYKFFWVVADGGPSLHDNPSLALQLDAGDEMSPDAPQVPEEALVALWDAVLDSAEQR